MKFATENPTLWIISGAALLVLSLQLLRARRLPKGLRLPPGPSGKFLIGSIPDLRNGYIWETVDKWAKEYGGLVRVSLLGHTIIIVNSAIIARDLLEKKSSIYSDRLQLPMLNLMGWDWNTALLPYGDMWRRHRKIFHQYFRPEAVGAYKDIQLRQTSMVTPDRNLLLRFYESSDDFLYHIRHLSGAIIMEITYGIKILPKDDPFVRTSEAVLAVSAEAAVPGKFLVNLFPILKHVPEWMPGGGFHTTARKWSVLVKEMADKPFETVKTALQAGTATPSIVGDMLDELSHKTDSPADEADTIRNVGANAYAAGADTIVASLSSFMLAMLVFPEVQRKAQAELDAIIGNRLPTFEDLGSLPYVNAVCKEVHRWYPSFPLGIGHRLTEDDVYGEYFIPAGSIVIGNSWTILHDENLYGPNTETFNPERFLRPGAAEPMLHFGFARRICPGRFMAENSIFIAVSSILKVFEILPARDKDGNEIPVNMTFKVGALTHPEPFPCVIQPRSESARSLLLNLVDE